MTAVDRRAADHRARELREAFDGAFALPARTPDRDLVSFLVVRVGGERYALPVAELRGVQVDRRIVRLPRNPVGLMGVAGVRGQIVPVYALATLLGLRGVDPSSNWLALAAAREPFALAFDEVEGYLQAPRSSVHAAEGDDASTRRLCELVRDGDAIRPVVSPLRIVAALRERPSPRRDAKEA